MATKNTNVTFGDISTQVSNKDASDKVFNINANAKINNDKFVGLEAGNFSKADGDGSGWFGFDKDNNFNFGCNGLKVEDIETAVKAVMDFYNNVKEALNSKNS